MLTRARRRSALAAVPVAALLGAALAAVPPASSAVAAEATVSAHDGYINYVAPRVDEPSKDVKVGDRPRKAADAVSQAHAFDRKHARGNPVAARQLAKLEREAVRTGRNPRQIKQAKSTQQARLLTLLVEFDDAAKDDFTGVMVPKTVFGSRECVPGGVQSGPLHNQIADPADGAAKDDNSFWVPDFSPAHFDRMLYTKEGITERVRPDLRGPDGKPGIDISGSTMRNMYEEMSKGAYTVSGKTTEWVTVDHSEAWYGADTCFEDADGVWQAGEPQGMQGHPDNAGGAAALAVDAVAALAEQQPGFPFADYDVEDQGDLDGDGDLFEPDGVIDHVVLVHAGEDKSGGGGAQGTYAVWAHSSTVTEGGEIPGTDLRVSNYIVQPEDSGVGVFAHEYGHDLGLPDLYDTTSGGDSDVDFWDLMSSGSHSGPIFQSMPTHMGLWDKWVLGWADPLVLAPGADARDVQLGQTSRTPRGTRDGIRVSLPDKTVSLTDPLSGTDMWWSGNDQDWAKNTLTRTVDVPAGTDVRFWMQNDYVIEQDWDYGFVEVSTDGGTTWTEQVVRDSTGKAVTTPEDYDDPNGRMEDFGGKRFGLTGDSHGWSRDYVDLTPFAGERVQLRLLYSTDEAFVERGWFADSFELTDGGVRVWADDVEGSPAGWTAETGTYVPGSSLGAGWRLDTGTQSRSHYYLAEWRNFDGFDQGLRYAYDTTYSSNGPWKVEKIPYNAPGMLVWYRDTSYGNDNPVLATTYDLPSTGTKGGLLIVDSHFDPLRRSGQAAAKDPSTLDNAPSRVQSSNAAFGLTPTHRFDECLAEVDADPYTAYCTTFPSQPAVPAFSDAKSYYPGIEVRGSSLFFRDVDASVVVPSRDNTPYSVRVVDSAGAPLTSLHGVDVGLGSLLGTGNPADGDFDASNGAEDLRIGVGLTVVRAAKDNSSATVRVQPAPAG